VFHGTAASNVQSICSGGFKVGGQDGHPVVNGVAFGQGVYTDRKVDIRLSGKGNSNSHGAGQVY